MPYYVSKASFQTAFITIKNNNCTLTILLPFGMNKIGLTLEKAYSRNGRLKYKSFRNNVNLNLVL